MNGKDCPATNCRGGVAALADSLGVTIRQLQRDGDFARDVNTLEAAIPGTRDRILDGKTRIPRAVVADAAGKVRAGRTEQAERMLEPEGLSARKKRLKETARERAILDAARRLLRLAGSAEQAGKFCFEVEAHDRGKP